MEAAGIEPASEELAKEVSPGSAFELHPAAAIPQARPLGLPLGGNRHEAVFRFAERPKAGFRVG